MTKRELIRQWINEGWAKLERSESPKEPTAKRTLLQRINESGRLELFLFGGPVSNDGRGHR